MFFWDYLRLLCDDQICGVLVPGTLTLGFYDRAHITNSAGRYLWPFLCGFLRCAGVMARTGGKNSTTCAAEAASSFGTDTSEGRSAASQLGFSVFGYSSIGLLLLTRARPLVVAKVALEGPA